MAEKIFVDGQWKLLEMPGQVTLHVREELAKPIEIPQEGGLLQVDVSEYHEVYQANLRGIHFYNSNIPPVVKDDPITEGPQVLVSGGTKTLQINASLDPVQFEKKVGIARNLLQMPPKLQEAVIKEFKFGSGEEKTFPELPDTIQKRVVDHFSGVQKMRKPVPPSEPKPQMTISERLKTTKRKIRDIQNDIGMAIYVRSNTK